MPSPVKSGSTKSKDGSTKKKSSKSNAPPKIKKSVLAEQSRLIEEAQTALIEQENKRQLDAKKAAEQAAQLEEQKQKQREAEKERLLSQTWLDLPLLMERSSTLQSVNDELNAAVDWSIYLQCSPLPNVKQAYSLETYMSLWRDALRQYQEQQQSSHHALSNDSTSNDSSSNAAAALHTNYKSVIEQCCTAEQVIQLIKQQRGALQEQLVSTDYESESKTHRLHQITILNQYIAELRRMTTIRLDQLTASWLQRIDEFDDSSSVANVTASSSTNNNQQASSPTNHNNSNPNLALNHDTHVVQRAYNRRELA
jgi:hypothetical protein